MYYVNEAFIIDAVNNHTDMILRIAFQYVRDFSTAEDIVQDVFVALLKQSTFASDEHLKAWLIRVVINKCKDYLKSARVKRSVSLKEVKELGFTKEDVAIHNEIARLDEDERNLIYLYYFEGYKVNELAILLELKENTVSKKLERARARLKDFLEE